MSTIQRVFTVYFASSSAISGFVEFIHDYKRFEKNVFIQKIVAENTLDKNEKSIAVAECLKKSIPGFFFGALLGPAVPIFYLAGVKALDWKRCPKLK